MPNHTAIIPVYRTLQAFTEKGLIQVGSNAGGIARYEVQTTGVRTKQPTFILTLFARIMRLYLVYPRQL